MRTADETRQHEVREIDAKIERLQRVRDEAKDRLRKADAEVEAAHKRLLDEQGRVVKLTQDIVETTPQRLLEKYIANRTSSDDYRSHLGIVARIREDFEHISKLVEEQNWTLMPSRPDESPREHLEKIATPEAEKLGEQGRINRIILYVDDLDRCPPRRVVQVPPAASASELLRIEEGELAFMRDLSPLLGRSPRALKRFVNVYRLLKASLRRVDSTRLRGENDRRPVLFLLAVEAGLPRLASRMLTVLLESRGAERADSPGVVERARPCRERGADSSVLAARRAWRSSGRRTILEP